MYDLEKDLHFRPQRVRCQVTLYNDMGHMMPRVQWFDRVDSGVRSLLEKNAVDLALKDVQNDVVDYVGNGGLFLQAKVPSKTTNFKLYNYEVRVDIVYDF